MCRFCESMDSYCIQRVLTYSVLNDGHETGVYFCGEKLKSREQIFYWLAFYTLCVNKKYCLTSGNLQACPDI